MGDTNIIKFIREQYDTQPHFLEVFLHIRNPSLRADLKRCLLLAKEGGYYGSIDTILVRPTREWMPHGSQNVRFVIGMEYNRMTNAPLQGFQERISFILWTFATAAGHPIVIKAIERAMRSIESFAAQHNSSIGNIDVPDTQASQVTGQSIWSTAVFEGLSRETP